MRTELNAITAVKAPIHVETCGDTWTSRFHEICMHRHMFQRVWGPLRPPQTLKHATMHASTPRFRETRTRVNLFPHYRFSSFPCNVNVETRVLKCRFVHKLRYYC